MKITTETANPHIGNSPIERRAFALKFAVDCKPFSTKDEAAEIVAIARAFEAFLTNG